jgi:flagellar protein FliS
MNKSIKMYQTHQVNADVAKADKKDLLIMLYDGVINNLKVAKDAIESKNIALKLHKVDKTLNIIEMGLLACLDRKKSEEVANSLSNFYEDAYSKIVTANINNDGKALEDVRGLFVDLKKCWEKA